MKKRPQVVGAAIFACAGFACFFLMAREPQLRHATVLGLLLLSAAVLGLFSAFRLLAPPHDAVRLELRTLLRRPALLVLALGSLLYLPWLGSYGLWDPWETHYGEVAREVMSRDDWISLWQAKDRWFWTKPILIFWTEALTWSASGLGFGADQHIAHTEWVLRLPIFAMSMAALFSVYFAMARIWSPRVGVLSALVLATTPYYALLSRQAVTDMPLVANMTVAMMLFLIACSEDPERRARTVRVGRVGLSLQHLVIALVVLIALPQLLYLASRNISFGPPFELHRDVFLYGSAGNSDVPGNPEHELQQSVVSPVWCQPLAQALLFGSGLAVILWRLRRERRAQALYMCAFYVFCGLAFLAKGIPGFALPGLVALLYLIAARRFQLLFDGRLHVGLGMLIVSVLGMPWFVAMYVRHGGAFIHRILIHDHINRLTSGVHGDNGTIQYFIWQLGYGMFPWVALVPVALALWLRPGASERGRQREALHVLGLWFAVSFTLFSAMTTKFHHYILPAVPPMAALIGLVLARLLPPDMFRDPRRTLRTAAAMIAPLCWVLALAGFRGDVRGIIPEDAPVAQYSGWVFAHPWPLWACAALLVAGALLAGFAFFSRDQESGEARVGFGPLLVCGAIVCAFAGRDLSWNVNGQPPGSERLIHLFVYNYTRPWPEHFDYRPILFGFAAVSVGLSVACAARKLRSVAAPGLVGIALAFCVFCLDVYLFDLTPHWTQKGLLDKYYAERGSAEEPLLAYQMNWKGENFYTGNRVYMFYDLDTTALEDWIGANKGRRVYFLLEHTRVDRLRKLLPAKNLELLTTKRDCNKFLLARAAL